MIKQQFKNKKILIAGIVAFVIAIGVISVYGYTQYGPKQITISSLDASTGKRDTQTVTASKADTVEKVLRDNHIPIDNIHYFCSENLNSKIIDISQIHIEKKTTLQSKSTTDRSSNQPSSEKVSNLSSASQNDLNTQNTFSSGYVSSSNSVTDGSSNTSPVPDVQPLEPIDVVSNHQETNTLGEVNVPKDTLGVMSINLPQEDNDVSSDVTQKEVTKSETSVVKPVLEIEIDSTIPDASQEESKNNANNNINEVSNNVDVDNSKKTSSTHTEGDIENTPLENVTNEVKNTDNDTKANAEQSVKTEIVEMDIPYGTKRENSDQIKQGEEIVTTPGVNGLKNVTYEVTYVNDKIISRKAMSEEVITEPVTEVISVGTGTETTLQPNTDSSSSPEKAQEVSIDNQEQKEDNILDNLSEYALNINMSNGGSYGNITQSTSTINMDFVCAVVAQEGGTSYEGALGVISCIMNRLDSGAWGGTDVESIIKTPGQFEAFESGAYEKYLGQSLPEVEAAVRDCMDCGLRTHPYESFRSYQTDGSVTNIGGNWYF